MEYNFGSDGGGYYSSSPTIQEIGYTDGCPFVINNEGNNKVIANNANNNKE